MGGLRNYSNNRYLGHGHKFENQKLNFADPSDRDVYKKNVERFFRTLRNGLPYNRNKQFKNQKS